jgi:pimeloyl-ACP methyl ester carboxylesterase
MLEKERIINNFKIKYCEKQKTNGPFFVFLHGWGSNYKSFFSIYKNLDNYVVFDFPGFGESSNIKRPLTLSDYAHILSVISSGLKDKKIIFVAHSFGGRVLLKFLNQKNKIENIQQIICIGVPFIRNYNHKTKFIGTITKIFKIISNPLPKTMSKQIRKIWYKAIGSHDYFALENQIMKETFVNVINEDIFKIVHTLKNYKTDFIWGSNDKEAPLGGAKVVSEKVGARLHIIKNGGHFPFVGATSKEFQKIFGQITKI